MFNKLALPRHILVTCSAIGLAAIPASALAQEVPILLPGAPGDAPRVISSEQAVRIADTSFAPADVQFMQDMIAHHAQAVRMAALVKDRTNNPAIVEAAGRINASQADEIAFMENWLKQRGQPLADPHAAHSAQGHGAMPGMASPQEMAALAAARGPAFDRMFLELMIDHHEGALEMVETLLDQSGTAHDPILFEFTSDVKNEQEAEIERMSKLIVGLSPDPRSNLAAGFRDAGTAISNLTLVTSLPKPTGFFDPENPAGLPIEKPAKPGEEAEEEEGGDDDNGRSPLLSFSNTDMAFSGDLMAVGNYHGFNLYRLDANGIPQQISSVVCPGGQGDVSIVDDILIMSVEQTRGRVDCGLQGVGEDVSAERFRGLRIFNISNPARPVQVGQVQTCRGSHTHSVVSADAESIIVYVSGTAGVREEEEMAGCIGDIPGDERTALFRIDVVEIPLDDPSKARIIDSPAVFADPETGALAGLWRGGDHGDDTQDTRITNQCHDITVFPTRDLAAGACSGNGIIFDISDPRKPKRIDAVVDPGFAYWHSATFNNDGTKVIFTDEWGGGGRPRCQAHDPRDWGANAFYNIVDGELVARGHYKLPAAQTDTENCVAHNGSIIPVPGRDIFAQAWYQGGLSVIDFTNSTNPVEIAYFDRGPVSDEHLVTGGYWSTYWYDGKIYGTEIIRGLDVLALKPSEHLSEAEIAAARLAEHHNDTFNPQQQFPVTWPDHPVVARAYVDQLERTRELQPPMIASLKSALGQARERLESGTADAALAGRLTELAGSLSVNPGDAIAAERMAALRDTLTGIAARLR